MLLPFEDFKLFEEDNLPGFALLLPYSEYMDQGTNEEANLFLLLYLMTHQQNVFSHPCNSVLCQVV